MSVCIPGNTPALIPPTASTPASPASPATPATTPCRPHRSDTGKLATQSTLEFILRDGNLKYSALSGTRLFPDAYAPERLSEEYPSVSELPLLSFTPIPPLQVAHNVAKREKEIQNTEEMWMFAQADASRSICVALPDPCYTYLPHQVRLTTVVFTAAKGAP